MGKAVKDMKQQEASAETSNRRRKSLNRLRLMDGTTNPDGLGSGTPVVIYQRVSSEEQIENFSLAAQERTCRDFAEKRGWEIVEVFEDPGHSGKNDKRPSFQRLIAGAREQRFKVVLVHKLDRFSRNVDTTLKYFRILNECDVTIASATEDFDYSTPQGRLFFRMMASFAQWYLENLSAETVKGKRERALEGLHNGRLPFGYAVGPNKVAVLVPKEAEIVREAFEKYSTNQYTDREIAQFLNESGFVTRKGRRWSKDTVRDFLQNEFYYGRVAYRDQILPGNHEPVISRELFEQCQRVRSSHARRPKSFAQTPKRIYMLHRVICCNCCDRPLRMQSAHGSFYYKEASLERGLECEHAAKSIRMGLADSQMIELLKVLRLPDDWQSDLEERIADEDEGHRIEERRRQLNEKRRRLGRAYSDGTMEEDEYESKLKQIEAELDRLVVPSGADLLDKGLKLEQLSDLLDEADATELAELCQLILEQAYVDLAQGKIVRLKPSPAFMPLFRMAAPEMGWREADDGTLSV
jgi:site-specific DNA recombinase